MSAKIKSGIKIRAPKNIFIQKFNFIRLRFHFTSRFLLSVLPRNAVLFLSIYNFFEMLIIRPFKKSRKKANKTFTRY